jgi:protein disulfide-isomerase A6
MEEFKDSKTALVADVDCTVEEDLCGKHGVEGYPTIKHGDPAALQDYQGGREYDDLLTFAKENLGPTCGPKNLDLCDEAQKKEIEEAQALSDADLQAKIKEKEDAIAAEEKSFTEEVDKLQAKYEELSKAKDAKVAEIKKSGLSTLTTVCKDRPTCTPPAPPPSEEEEPEESEGDGADGAEAEGADGEEDKEKKEL